MALVERLKTLFRKRHAIVQETVLERDYAPYGWIVRCRCGWQQRAAYLMGARELWAKHAAVPEEAVCPHCELQDHRHCLGGPCACNCDPQTLWAP